MTLIKKISNGVVAPKGFVASGITCGIKKSGKKDLMLLKSEIPCNTVGAFTSNKVKAFCVDYNLEQLSDNLAQAIIVNSGNANCLTGSRGQKDNINMAKACATQMGIDKALVLTASTGIIGEYMPIQKVLGAVPKLVRSLKSNAAANSNAAKAILTTDRKSKSTAVEFLIGSKPVRIGIVAKGAGMIHPKMTISGQKHATMLCFITTDAVISKTCLKKAFSFAIDEAFNSISVDADMSTNDMTLLMANGLAKNKSIIAHSKEFKLFQTALTDICCVMAKQMIRDAEGATKFVEIRVNGAKSVLDARAVALSVASSKLVKTAFFGSDPNWGRIAASIGYANANVDADKLKISLGNYLVLKGRAHKAVKKTDLNRVFAKKEIIVSIDLGLGKHGARVWTTDLSLGYVRFNSAYHT
ncbi:MAG: glutamate N-acetyltransferase/amino-acid N-acetyltransferase [Candidatus Omnitrophota bacterium]|jgi:glutamate N-acetyltransferase/amino-acid N-acetyltransferase